MIEFALGVICGICISAIVVGFFHDAVFQRMINDRIDDLDEDENIHY